MITAVRGQSTNALWLARACPKAGTLLSSTPVQIASFLAFSAATGHRLRALTALIGRISLFLPQRLAADENNLKDSTSGGLILNFG